MKAKYQYSAREHWDVFKWEDGKTSHEPIADNAKWCALPPLRYGHPAIPRWFTSWQAAMNHVNTYTGAPV